ncbi:uncharacterized protein LOC129308952 [Prosopis cineraria]|uniref:uncharacterized protein LOC129308952 n=1 Tax=Prosopis cineraria TaxID=364024 RepID=UPI00240F94FF|nr:uncharacterized protein LOC129308952 [Prosopis cineraria]
MVQFERAGPESELQLRKYAGKKRDSEEESLTSSRFAIQAFSRKTNITIVLKSHRKFTRFTAYTLAVTRHPEVEDTDVSCHVSDLTGQRQQTLLNNNRENLEGDLGSSSSSSIDNRRCPRQQQFRPNDIKVDIPEFKGRLQPDKFVDWLQTVERVFEYKEILDVQKVKIVALKLKKLASIWWENLRRKWERERKHKIETWEREKEEQTIARYLAGLNTDISRPVQLQQYWTLDDVIRLALRVEKQMPKRSTFQPSSSRGYPKGRKVEFQQTNSSSKPQPTAIHKPPSNIAKESGSGYEALEEDEEDTKFYGTDPVYNEEVILADQREALVLRQISNYMVEKLKLPTQDHPQPYKLHWLNKGNEEEFKVLKSEAQMMSFILVLEVNDETANPPRVIPLLSEFPNVISDEIPPRLPPMRDIQHAIDFVPRAVIPNKPAYRMSLQEHAEVQRQVEELLKKGFHGLASFYRRFIHNFSSIAAPLIDCTKGEKFQWTEQAQKSFEELKKKLTEAPVLALPNFDQVFEVSCDTSNTGISAVLSQDGHPIAFFSEKLNDAKLRYSTYDKKFYAIVRALQYWSHYLLNKEFILFSDHEALKYLNSQQKISRKHARWSKLLQSYPFLIKHKAGTLNSIADALSRRHVLLTTLQTKVVGFDFVKELYQDDPDF